MNYLEESESMIRVGGALLFLFLFCFSFIAVSVSNLSDGHECE